jgi:hypothetical protein
LGYCHGIERLPDKRGRNDTGTWPCTIERDKKKNKNIILMKKLLRWIWLIPAMVLLLGFLSPVSADDPPNPGGGPGGGDLPVGGGTPVGPGMVLLIGFAASYRVVKQFIVTDRDDS